jgi:tetratricopeptide (TPR) repeat protein
MVSSLLVLAASAHPLPAQEPPLGTLTFSNSGKAAAQSSFLRGVLLLHSFEYDDAAREFQAARQADPTFALAYWGDAMTRTHPLWNEQDSVAARKILADLGATADLRAAKALTPRERGYLAAVEALYGPGSKPRRDTLYSRVMASLVARFPDDDEAKAFYALSLMGLNQGVRDVASYMRAGAIALELLERHPDHPGAAHYVIHAFDDPVHAPLGLRAARAYSRIAPGADHAQHMTTHIFLALGMWPEVVQQNVIASGSDSSRWQPGHYTMWLGYGLTQEGRFRDGHELLERLHSQLPANATAGRRGHLAILRAHQVMNAERWDDPSLDWPIELSDASVVARAIDAFTRGYAGLQRGNPGAARDGIAAIRAIGGTGAAGYASLPEVPRILAGVLEAGLMHVTGGQTEAIARLDSLGTVVGTLPVDFGPPELVKPVHELLGEWLLEARRPKEAEQAFTRALALAPGRLRSLQGLVRAATAAGDPEVAESAQRTLDGLRAVADPGVVARR